MPRDWDLVRAILLALEQLPDFKGQLRPEDIQGYNAALVTYHIMLIEEAGLIEAIVSQTMGGEAFALGRRMTWAGHELLDAIRAPSMWNRIKRTALDKGLDLTLDVILAIAKKLAELAL